MCISPAHSSCPPSRFTPEDARYLSLSSMPQTLRNYALSQGRTSANILNNATGDQSLKTVFSLPGEKSYEEFGKSYLRDLLDKNFPGFSGSYWKIILRFKKNSLEVFKIMDSSFRPYRVFNFMNCYREHTYGHVLVQVG